MVPVDRADGACCHAGAPLTLQRCDVARSTITRQRSLQGSIYCWASEPQTESTLNTLIDGITQHATADAFKFFNVDKSYAARLLRPLSKLQKSWHFFALGLPFCLVIPLLLFQQDAGASVAKGRRASTHSDSTARAPDFDFLSSSVQLNTVLLQCMCLPRADSTYVYCRPPDKQDVIR